MRQGSVPGHSLAPPSTVTTLTGVEDVFVKVFIFVVVASVCCFGELTHSVSLVGTRLAVVVFAFFVGGEVVTVVVTASPAFNTVVTKADGVVVEVTIGAWDVVVDGTFGGAVTDFYGFVLDAANFFFAVVSVVTAFKVDAVVRNFSNEFFPSGVELVATFVDVVGSVAKESVVKGDSFHDFVAVFVLDGEVTVEGLTCILVVVTGRAGEALVVYFNPVRTVFQSA